MIQLKSQNNFFNADLVWDGYKAPNFMQVEGAENNDRKAKFIRGDMSNESD